LYEFILDNVVNNAYFREFSFYNFFYHMTVWSTVQIWLFLQWLNI